MIRTATAFQGSLQRFLRRFANHESGSVIVMFALSAMLLVAMAGAGTDLARHQLTVGELRLALDAGAVSAASLQKTDGTEAALSDDVIIAAAKRYFNLNHPPDADGAQPEITASIAHDGDGSNGGILSVSIEAGAAASTTKTMFLSGWGMKELKASELLTKVGTSLSGLSDYDVVMLVDESGSEGAPTGSGKTREQDQQDVLRAMVDSIMPDTMRNPNVRIGIIGFTGYISNKWGLSSKKEDVKSGIDPLRPRYQNFDHTAMLAAAEMFKGGTTDVGSGDIEMCYGCIAANISQPVPRTARKGESDPRVMSKLKYLVFLSDGGIMIEPTTGNDPTGLLQKYAGNGLAAFEDACDQVRNAGGPNAVHIIIVDFVTPYSSAQGQSLMKCASDSLAGGKKNKADSYKTNPNKDFYFAPNTFALQEILKSVTNQIKSVRILPE